MKHVSHFANGQVAQTSERTGAIVSPRSGETIGQVELAGAGEVDQVVAAARNAQPDWGESSISMRSEVMLELRSALRAHRQELADLIVEELGKSPADALAELHRGAEALAFASNIGPLTGAPATPSASTGVDISEIRQPVGIIATISPFNFPAMIPIVQCALPIAAGNAVISKPSERDPSVSTRIAQIFSGAGLPAGIFNVIHGDAATVEALIDHPDVDGISFVGSSAVAKAIRERGVRAGKRVQAFGGGKNHLVVMPDADLDQAADAAISAAFGAAGQRCMATSVLVAVGGIADGLVSRIAERMGRLSDGAAGERRLAVDPVISAAALSRITTILERAVAEGAILAVDGRAARLPTSGNFIGATLLDHVRQGSIAHDTEIFGPVLSIVRTANFAEALDVISCHALGNGASIFTRDGRTARRFAHEVRAGCIGINVPIPLPVFYHNFGGWKDSAFTETKLFGPGAIEFCTRSKTVVTRWPDSSNTGIELGFPSSR